jgi:phosphohistidine phosphatase
MDILLWRHAEADDSTPDAARALTERGHAQARRVARWLESHAPADMRLISSPARRAKETALAFTPTFEIDPRLSPGQSLAEHLKAIGGREQPGAVMVVGHQPTLGQLAAHLLGWPDTALSFKKGSLWWFSLRIREGVDQTVLRAVISPEFL